jgi:hypothetical protein
VFILSFFPLKKDQDPDPFKKITYPDTRRPKPSDPENPNPIFITRIDWFQIGDLPQASYLQQTILDLNIGTYNGIEVGIK